MDPPTSELIAPAATGYRVFPMRSPVILPALAVLLVSPWLSFGRGDPELMVLGPNYPRVFFFRGSEGPPALPKTTYEDWDSDFNRLMGIMGKCLDEEVLGREKRNPEFFGRFKREHPTQVVLLHFNGNSRDPRHGTGKYFPGHWTYRGATRILADVPDQAGETTIRVEDASDFQVGGGRYRTSNDDVALFGVTEDGGHDWAHCEQVQLLAVDKKSGTIRVRRACYGTRPLAFKAGAARAAAHAVEGPWGKNNNLLWFYNFSTHCPRDADGKNCADRLVDDLAAWFGKGGKLADFDGLEFDVMFNETRGDTDGDGRIDDGVIGGINHYGIGVIEFARQLRARLGDGRIIQGDGALGPGGRRSQRAFGILNGIESEGFPNLDDWDFEDWSGGLNRHAFWGANGRAPAFSYINHKWVEPVPGKPGEHKNPEVPFSRHRLSFAAGQFTDSAICYSFAPPRDAGGKFGVWDEFRCGTDNRLGWLGKPEGPAVRMATKFPDLLQGAGNPAGDALAKRITGRVRARACGDGIVIEPATSDTGGIEFTIRDIPATGKDMVVLLTMSGQPMKGYPREMARFVECELSGGMISLMGKVPESTGMALRGAAETEIDRTSGAAIRNQVQTTIDDRTLPAYAIHPPYQMGKGYVFWCRDVDIPPSSDLRFNLGMSEKAPARSDGVWFKVFVSELSGNRPGPFEPVFEKTTKAHEWIPCSIPLRRFAGKRVRLKFVADCGPRDNATTDQGYWADVKIVRAGLAESEVTPSSTHMTWLNDRPFTSAFYFRELRSKSVDLSVSVEGAEPMTVIALSAHAHPDAMCRVFQQGLVIANPAHEPYTFDLGEVSPGRRYRRIRAVLTQDAEANNGQPVAGRITLGERDALFLVRVP